MKNRFARIFQAGSGKTVMLAIDHGYFQGPTTGLERVDISIRPLLPYADTLMVTRGILRSVIPPTFPRGVVLRATGGRRPCRVELEVTTAVVIYLTLGALLLAFLRLG